jgi:very-short-patch-repair endonuclease
MRSQLPRAELETQHGIISRQQLLDAGVTERSIERALLSGRLVRIRRATYATFTGMPPRTAELWAAVLRAGPEAVLSHQTAAELHGLIDSPSKQIHVTVPASRHPGRHGGIDGMVIHRSNSVLRTRHPVLLPPRTRVEETVLDLTQDVRTFDDAFAWLCRAVGRHRTTASRLREAMADRKKIRWRAEMAVALGDVETGVHSLLEYRYLNGVERAHGLPHASRQERIRRDTGSKYLDNLYAEYQVSVELDGRAAHPADEQWRDKRRDNGMLASGIVTFRFGLLEVTRDRCQSAGQVGSALRERGWPGVLRRCGPACRAVIQTWPGRLAVALLGVVVDAVQADGDADHQRVILARGDIDAVGVPDPEPFPRDPRDDPVPVADLKLLVDDVPDRLEPPAAGQVDVRPVMQRGEHRLVHGRRHGAVVLYFHGVGERQQLVLDGGERTARRILQYERVVQR